jgi:N-acetylglucosamine-6-sulfatase
VYLDPPLNVDGRPTPSTGYITDILTTHAVDFIRESTGPFCVYLAHKAIHPNAQQRDDGSRVDPTQSDAPEAFIPAERHKHLYEGKTPPRRGNYLRPPQAKPALEDHPEGRPPLGPTTGTTDAVILARMRTMKAIDESLGSILSALEARHALDKTIVIFTSDHGFFYGEHCLGPERRLAYEETIRIPLLVRYPPRFRPKSTPSQFVMNVDIAPTVLTLAGIIPTSMHGRPLWATPHRDAVLIEYFSDTVFPRIRNMGYQAIRTQRWKYIHYQDIKNADELYDVRKDPFELHNLITDTKAPRKELQQRLNELLRESGAAT